MEKSKTRSFYRLRKAPELLIDEPGSMQSILPLVSPGKRITDRPEEVSTDNYRSLPKAARQLQSFLNQKTLYSPPAISHHIKLGGKPGPSYGQSFIKPPKAGANNISFNKPNSLNVSVTVRRSSQVGVVSQHNSIHEDNQEFSPEKEEKNEKQDILSPNFFSRLTSCLTPLPGQRSTRTVLFGKKPKRISLKNAKRILNLLAETLKPTKSAKIDEKATRVKKYHQSLSELDEAPARLAKFRVSIDESIQLCEKAIEERNTRIGIDGQMKKMIDTAYKAFNYELILYFTYTQAKIFMARCDFKHAINEFKHFKDLCTTYDLFTRKLEAYKQLGKCYQGLKMYKTAIIYFSKFLYMAWYIDSTKYELLAYDHIGMQYFYLGRLELAEHFHNRMVSGKLEPKSSRIRQIGVLKIKQTDPNYISQGNARLSDLDFDLDLDLQWVQKKKAVIEVDDEFGEVSGRDDGFEPPLPNFEEENDLRGDRFRKTRTGPASKSTSTIKTIPGFAKARVQLIRKNEEKGRKRYHNVNRSQNDDSPVRDIGFEKSHFRTSSTSALSQKLNEQVLMSHLSRNRGLKNFSSQGVANMAFLLSEYDGYNDDLDAKSSDEIKRILEKVKLNLLAIKQRLMK